MGDKWGDKFKEETQQIIFLPLPFKTNTLYALTILMTANEKDLHHILERHLPYYRNLDSEFKMDFRKRTKHFINRIHFRGGHDFKISLEHIAAISGAFVQISFGKRYYFLNEFEVITIYKNEYKSTITGLYHKGDVNPSGAIAISWKDFVQGYKTDEDNLNVGLHEMAHAWFFSISHVRYDEQLSIYDLLSKFIFLTEAEIVKIRKHKQSIFRKYASENVYEFFAVAIEYFFEDAKEFKRESPNLYRHLCLLLNQDPAESIYRGIKVEDYFKQQNFYGELSPEKAAQFPEEKLGIKATTHKKKLFTAVFVIWLISFIIGLSSEIEDEMYYYISIGISFLVLLYFYIKQSRESVSISQNYMIFRGRRYLRKYIIGIHFDNILTVDINNKDQILTLKYLDKSEIFQKTLTAFFESDFTRFIHILAQHNVVLKNEGTRVPRIKSRNRWRK